MLFENADISTTVINGRIESLYIIFTGEVANETLRFDLDDGEMLAGVDHGGEVLVDVDCHDAVLAVQLLSLDGEEATVVEEIRCRLPEVHAAALAMVTTHRAKSGSIRLSDLGDMELMINSEGLSFGEGAILPSGIVVPAAPSGKVWMVIGGCLVLQKKPTNWGI